MRIKEGFALRDVADNYVVVPLGKRTADFNGMVKLNETGAFLWGKMNQDCTEEELAAALAEAYDVSEEQEGESVGKFLEKLRKEGFVTD